MTAPRITFGRAKRYERAGQTQVEVRFGSQPVGYLARWLEGEIAKHGWFFVANHPLARACFDFGFPPGRESLGAAKAAVVATASAHRLVPQRRVK